MAPKYVYEVQCQQPASTQADGAADDGGAADSKYGKYAGAAWVEVILADFHRDFFQATVTESTFRGWFKDENQLRKDPSGIMWKLRRDCGPPSAKKQKTAEDDMRASRGGYHGAGSSSGAVAVAESQRDAERQRPRTPLLERDVLITSVPHGLAEADSEARDLRDTFGARAEVLPDISIADLPSALEGRSTWFFVGHGDAPLLHQKVPAFFKDGRVESVSIDAVVAAVKPHAEIHGGNLNTVVFNGCCTYDLCKALHEQAGVENIVCWKTVVYDAAAAIFGPALAVAIVAKKPLAEAFEDAKTAVLTATGLGHHDSRAMGKTEVQRFEL